MLIGDTMEAINSLYTQVDNIITDQVRHLHNLVEIFNKIYQINQYN